MISPGKKPGARRSATSQSGAYVKSPETATGKMSGHVDLAGETVVLRSAGEVQLRHQLNPTPQPADKKIHARRPLPPVSEEKPPRKD
jgi:hypothetical protein